MSDLSNAVQAVKDFSWWNYGLDEVNDTQSDDWAHALVDEIAPLIIAAHTAGVEETPTPTEPATEPVDHTEPSPSPADPSSSATQPPPEPSSPSTSSPKCA